jgi:CBS domain-containing protein
MLPLLVAVIIAHAFTVLALRRSILTEKLSRRGHHLAREYAVDVLEGTLVHQGMQTNLIALPAEAPIAELSSLHIPEVFDAQVAYPIVDANGRLTGMISARHLGVLAANAGGASPNGTFADLSFANFASIGPDATMREAADQIAASGRLAVPVVNEDRVLLGIVTVRELLAARATTFAEEWTRQRSLTLRMPFVTSAARARQA